MSDPIKNLDARLVATNQLLDAALQILGLGDLASSEFSAQELEDAGGFVAAYQARRGAVGHLNFKIVAARIDAGDGRDGGGVDPAVLRSVYAVPIRIVNQDEVGEGVFRGHERHPAVPPATSQESLAHPDGFGGARDASILGSHDREGNFVFVQATKRSAGLLMRAGVKRPRTHAFYKVPVRHCGKVNGLQLNGKAV